MGAMIRKEVEFYQEVDIEVELEDFDDDDLIQEIVDRGLDVDMVQAIDEKMDSWDFTRRMRDYFVSEMAKHEMVKEEV